MKKGGRTIKFSKKRVVESIMREARVLDVPPGAAELFAEQVVRKIEPWARRRKVMTEKDLDLRIGKELEQYHQDLAYIYKNRGRII